MIWSLKFVKENKSGSKKGYELHMFSFGINITSYLWVFLVEN